MKLVRDSLKVYKQTKLQLTRRRSPLEGFAILACGTNLDYIQCEVFPEQRARDIDLQGPQDAAKQGHDAHDHEELLREDLDDGFPAARGAQEASPQGMRNALVDEGAQYQAHEEQSP